MATSMFQATIPIWNLSKTKWSVISNQLPVSIFKLRRGISIFPAVLQRIRFHDGQSTTLAPPFYHSRHDRQSTPSPSIRWLNFDPRYQQTVYPVPKPNIKIPPNRSSEFI